MLHAFNIKNVRRVLHDRPGEHKNAKNEDAVTSMVFTPLVFMTTSEASRCLALALGPGFTAVAGEMNFASHHVDFWPSDLSASSWNQRQDASRCEPDVVVRFRNGDGAYLAVLIEMKWDWKVTDEHLTREVARQRAAIREDHRWANATIVTATVAKHYPGRPAGIDVATTWIDILARLKDLQRRTGTLADGRPLHVWAELVGNFLERVDIRAFQGFADWAGLQPTFPQSPVFYRSAS
ncbi:MAG: hypothetical protein JNK84_02275 [Phreatobacter sp.]|uniref:hypothetical protein n=1 Tax=Phreatobacter sp. TaxID=1966341 RepID=UPI001A60367C|nr:hypothetical protein [Phreatobacter sp.]MBL8567888.1 hypothetical protein [Phreatobacter sp.]